MDPHERDPHIAAHVQSISTRAQSETDRLSQAILGHCWPGGASDRTEVFAREWVRRWGPRGVGTLPPACRCGAGLCPVCN